MLLVEWRPAAEDDLLAILTYIAEANVQAAADTQMKKATGLYTSGF